MALAAASGVYLLCMAVVPRAAEQTIPWLDVWFHNLLLVAAGLIVLAGAGTRADRLGWRFALGCWIALILVDITLPDLNGYEVTLRLRGIRELAQTPIVAVSSDGDPQTSLAVGADGFIDKPVDARRLYEAVLARIGPSAR